MTVTINASTSTGLVQTADTSGIIKLQSNGVTTNALAWANFNGSGGVSGITSYNVSSITRASTGLYTLNFNTATTDANYVIAGYSTSGNNTFISATSAQAKTTSACAFYSLNSAGPVDGNPIAVVIFGN